MLRTNTWGGRQFRICLIVLIAAAGFSFAAERQNQQQTKNSRKEQLRLDAQESFPDVENQLTQILEKVNINRNPSDGLIAQAETTLKTNKRYSLAYEDEQRATYMLLMAWTKFYQDNLPDAMKYSLRGCKLDSTSLDAWISQAVFCMLSDKRPRLPRVKKPQQRRPQQRRNSDGLMMPGMAPDISQPADTKLVMKKGTLEFDLKMLASAKLKERFDKIDYKKGWEEEYGYDPNQHTLCLLFWQSDEEMADDEDNDVPETPEPVDQGMPEMMMPGMMSDMMDMPMPGMSPGMSDHHLLKLDAKSVKGQQEYFGLLFRGCREHEQVKFVQINTDLPETAKEVAEKWYTNPDSEKNPRLVFAADSDIDPKKYAELNEVGPLMLIVNNKGKVTYAGPAATFAPAFILTALTGVELDLEKMAQAEEAAAEARRNAQAEELRQAEEAKRLKESGRKKPAKSTPPPMPMDMMVPGMIPPGMMPQPTPVPPQQQKPAGDPNTPDPAKATPGGQPAQKQQEVHYRELSLEDQIKAQNLLREGQLHIEESRKIRGKNPEKGIVACRKVLAEYGDTEFAEQARELLRRVPSRYKERFNITDEELGL